MKQILDSFCFLLDKYEHCEWMRGATKSEIQNVLQCARDVESVYSLLETRHCVTAFENKLNEWHQLKYGIKAHYKLQEFAAACDLILSNFLTNSKVPDEAVMYAATEYLQVCGRDRFELLKEHLICKAHTHCAVKNIIDELNTNFLIQKDVYMSTVGCELLKSIWRKYVQRGQTYIISNCIQAACTDGRFIDSVLRILVTEEFSEEENIMKRIIKESLLLKISAMSETDPAFWYTLVVGSRSLIVAVCDLYPEICSAFLRFISYIGNSMVTKFTETDCIWHNGENAKLISDITFNDLVSLVRCFLESQGLAGKHMRQTLQDLKSQPHCSVWVEVERQCGLPVLAKCFIASSSKDKFIST
ncbi:hypothetical protein Cfor_02203 [Coptotermes formosanus]|uniref:Uncharacterized protein n=1 Tax=Coptotermes formosanus TaxID=36987 RepID=A0A6L2Q8V0_COPFO|nr:hypothetical protein Cfor_02203 [Coptotermes formosanus]